MTTTLRNADDLRGLGRLAIDGVAGATDLVEAMHAAVTHLPAIVGKPAPVVTTGLTGFVYRSVRGVTRLVGTGVENSLSALAPLLGGGAVSPQREAVVAAMNGVVGDHLETSGNPLAIPMRFRRQGRPLPLLGKELGTCLPDATGKLLVLVHGLCMNDLQWNYAGHDHGQALQRDLGYTPVYLHYNTGRHISSNGQDLAALLEELARAWPVPLEEIALLCHSMGGLVARSALDEAFATGLAWSKLPIRIIFLGTPHHGAPLERAGSWVDMLIGISPYSAPFVRLGKIRSAGIQDLRHGNLRDSDWQDGDGDGLADGRTPMPLPKQVQAYAMVASTQNKRKDGGTDSLRGDGLVPIASGLGQHKDRDFDLRIPKSRQWVGYGINHLELLGSETVYRRLKRWLRKPIP
ncbi:esterase/lipase family protein [Pseudoxanthomonas sacheonensis]|uniref:Pimeloyl-ACP methyl ester carboxylesterase n=1 Tax=Pseudoxanthomonas sacheonensis TaxID=443615 RepID=A0ABU1RQP2_9GAMM|nr:alpha/beta hydrolase [Pseudoxanthomonas sacheonensis]MDR6840439.1 pimeloyl-ACP methyl ester carboxylesterase [Pseudoxanthomonas sacheonensis]